MYSILFRILVTSWSMGLLLGCMDDDRPTDPTSYIGSGQPVVYGEDDRMDYYAHPDEELRRVTRESIVALIPPSDLDMSNPDDIGVLAPTLGDYYNLCSDQRFRDQPTAAYCSGTLIDDDLVLTAGHCVESTSECRGTRFVFNYYYESEGELATITTDDVYECEQLVVQSYTSTVDYAILQLDRHVSLPHRPAPVRLEDSALAVGASVPIIGFGSGLPAKIDDGGQVVDARASTLDYFMATTDTFGGNSGSGVFDADLQVVGILVRGEPDYVWTGDCRVVNVLPADGGGTGEDITYVYRAIEDLCENEVWPSPRLCGGGTGDGWCDPCTGVDDCPDGWSCRSWPEAASVTWCSMPCDQPADCQEGHHCTDAGYCEPDLSQACSQGDVWTFDSCRNRLWVATDCAPDELCADAACVDRMPGDVCSGATSIEGADQTLTGNLANGYQDDYHGTCGGGGAERVYQFTLGETRRLVAQATGFDTLLYLRSSCLDDASEVTCNDDSTPPGSLGSRIAATLDPGTYFLFMDAYNTSVGSYSLTLTFTDPGVIPDGDTCSNATSIEPVTQTLTGDLSADYMGDTRGSCAGGGADRVYHFTLATPQDLVAEATGFDTVLYVRSACGDSSSEVVCNDDATPPGDYGSHIEASLEADEYYLFIDTYSSWTGAYGLDLTFTPVCADVCVEGALECVGNGVRECLLDTTTGCTSWGPVTPCQTGETCLEGVCVSPCPDPCEVGSQECFGDGYRVCQLGDDGCPAWSPPIACASDEECVDGACVPRCTDACELGARRCSGEWSYQECRLGSEGCTVWSAPVTCPPAHTCEQGECVSICQDECVPGSRRCTPDGLYQVCQGGVPCSFWGPAQACDENEVCSEGECLPVCADLCPLGDRRCVGAVQWQECVLDESGCTVWGETLSCGEGERCDDGVCGTVCTNRCALGEQECFDDTSYRVCGDFDEDACLEWSDPVTCPEDQVCSGYGECAPACPDDGHEPNDVVERSFLLSEPTTLDLTVCQSDDDWFAMELEVGQQLTVTVAFDPLEGNVDLELYDQDQVTLIDTSNSPDAGQEEISYAQDTTAMVYWRVLLVSGTVMDYEMAVEVQPVTEDQCRSGERRCTSDGEGFQKCVQLEESGTWVWSEVERCGPGAVCVDDGACVLSDEGLWDIGIQGDDAAPDLVTDLSSFDGGVSSPSADTDCGCMASGHDRPHRTAILLGMVVLAWRRRRFRVHAMRPGRSTG